MSLRRAIALLTLVSLLGACAAPAASVPTATVAPSATIAPSKTPQPSVTPQPSATPAPTISPTTISLPTVNPSLAMTPTPGFPESKIIPTSLGALRQLRTVGYGQAQSAAFVGADKLTVVTSAGLLWFSLPTLRVGRFDPVPGGLSNLTVSPDGALLAFVAASGQGAAQATTILRSADGVIVTRIDGTSPTFSPDGQHLATQDLVNQMATLLWDTANWVKVAQLKGTAPIFSPDGRLVATCQSQDSQKTCGEHPDQTLTLLWRNADGGTVAQVKGAAPVFSPDGQFVATHNASAGMLLSKTADGATITYLTDDRVAFSPDGKWLAGASASGLTLYPITISGLGSARRLSTAAIRSGPVFSADGQRIIAVEGDLSGADDPTIWNSSIVTWSAVEQQELTRVKSADSGFFQKLSPYGTMVDIGFGGECIGVSIYRSNDGTSLSADAGVCREAFFSPEGTRVALLDINGGLSMIDSLHGDVVVATQKTYDYTTIAFSTDGGLMATASGTNMDIWQVISSSLLSHAAPASPHLILGNQFERLSFSPDNTQVIHEGENSAITLSLWVDLQPVDGSNSKQNIDFELPTAPDTIENMPWAYSFLAGRLAWIGKSGMVHLLAANDSRKVLEQPGPYTALAFSPDGSLLVAARRDGALQLFRPADGGDLGKLDSGREIEQLVFSPDGSLLATRSADGNTTIWRLADRTHLADLKLDPDDPGTNNGMPRSLPSLIFSADNSMLIIGGSHGVAFYAPASGRELRRLKIAAEGLALGPRQRLLAILSQGQVTLWGVP